MIPFLIASFLITIGLLSLILPILPGPAIAFAGILIHKLMLGDASVTWSFIVFAAALTLIAHLIDFFGSLWGARYFGASWIGALGALVGAVVGFVFFNFFGLLLGPIIGVFLFERLNHKNNSDALKASFGTLVGAMAAFCAKAALTLMMIFAFFSNVIVL